MIIFSYIFERIVAIELLSFHQVKASEGNCDEKYLYPYKVNNWNLRRVWISPIEEPSVCKKKYLFFKTLPKDERNINIIYMKFIYHLNQFLCIGEKYLYIFFLNDIVPCYSNNQLKICIYNSLIYYLQANLHIVYKCTHFGKALCIWLYIFTFSDVTWFPVQFNKELNTSAWSGYLNGTRGKLDLAVVIMYAASHFPDTNACIFLHK